MARRSKLLADTTEGIYEDHFVMEGQTQSAGYRVEKRRLRGGQSDGVDIIRVSHGDFGFEVVPTRGMGIRYGWVGPTRIGWDAPVPGPVHPAFVPLSDAGGTGWLCGFDELVTRCGLESNGAPEFYPNGRLRYPLHGRIANRPAHRVAVEADDRQVVVTGSVDESRLLGFKARLHSRIETTVGAAGFTVRDRIENTSGQDTTIQLIYHFNIGMPLLGPGARFHAPVEVLVPRDDASARDVATWHRYIAGAAQCDEQVFFLRLLGDTAKRSRVLLVNAAGDLAVSLAFSLRELPWFTLWKQLGAPGDGYVTGLEPGLNLPNRTGFEREQGRVLELRSGESFETGLEMEVLQDPESIREAVAAIEALQGTNQILIHERPQFPWCEP
ncbi:MAG: aldose 1-epimerase family protein [Gammaproteobacteria bacterium]|nr:aldose 1-epimerase family protein [Gammaproteobacteria bacterium]